MLDDVPRDLRMLLADRILVGQTEVVGVTVSLLAAYVHLQGAVFSDVEFTAITSDDLRIGLWAFFLFVLQIHLFGLFTACKSDR